MLGHILASRARTRLSTGAEDTVVRLILRISSASMRSVFLLLLQTTNGVSIPPRSQPAPIDHVT